MSAGRIEIGKGSRRPALQVAQGDCGHDVDRQPDEAAVNAVTQADYGYTQSADQPSQDAGRVGIHPFWIDCVLLAVYHDVL